MPTAVFVVGAGSFNLSTKSRQIFLLHPWAERIDFPAGFLDLNIVNSELCKKAAEKVGNPNVLVNLISRRVRQLNAGGGGMGRPLVANTTNQGVADIALREILEEKIGWDLPELVELVRPQAKKRRKR